MTLEVITCLHEVWHKASIGWIMWIEWEVWWFSAKRRNGGGKGWGRVEERGSFDLWRRSSFTPDLKSICLLTRNWLHPNMKNEVYIVCVNRQFALICTWFVSNLLIVNSMWYVNRQKVKTEVLNSFTSTI